MIKTNSLYQYHLRWLIVFPLSVSQLAIAELDENVTLDEIKITTKAEKIDLRVRQYPATVESINAQQIRETVNTVTTAGALQNLPSVHVRERYIGDRNAILVLRANSAIASAQTLVYADHLLLSNLLNNSFSTPPRWGMVAPNEIERIDIMYGPFSALYPGNSMGGVVNITTRMPEKFEAHAAIDGLRNALNYMAQMINLAVVTPVRRLAANITIYLF